MSIVLFFLIVFLAGIALIISIISLLREMPICINISIDVDLIFSFLRKSILVIILEIALIYIIYNNKFNKVIMTFLIIFLIILIIFHIRYFIIFYNKMENIFQFYYKRKYFFKEAFLKSFKLDYNIGNTYNETAKANILMNLKTEKLNIAGYHLFGEIDITPDDGSNIKLEDFHLTFIKRNLALDIFPKINEDGKYIIDENIIGNINNVKKIYVIVRCIDMDRELLYYSIGSLKPKLLQN